MVKLDRYSFEFINFVYLFYKRYCPDLNKTIVICASGGSDSSVLLDVFYRLHLQKKIAKPLVLHVNHLTKNANHFERRVKSQCESYGLELFCVAIPSELETKNFENSARIERHKIFSQFAKSKNAYLLLAHHLDDAFEWWLMQTFKSSNLSKTLGTPVRNRHLIRPFHCVSKDHINRYVKKNNIDFEEDPMNESVHFERIFVRKIIKKLKKRFPKLLKHFVHKQFELKNLLELKHSSIVASEILQFNDFVFIFFNEKRVVEYRQLESIVGYLSSKNRGKISDQLLKILKLIEEKKWGGPLNLSGGVNCLIDKEYCLFYKAIISEKKRGEYSKKITSEIPDYVFSELLLQSKSRNFSLNHPILKKLLDF